MEENQLPPVKKGIHFKDPKKFFIILSIVVILLFSLIIVIVVALNNIKNNQGNEQSVPNQEIVDENDGEGISKEGSIDGLEIKLFGLPTLSSTRIKLFKDESSYQSPKMVYKTGSVSKGTYTDGNEFNIDLEGFDVYKLFYFCNDLNVLHSKDYPYIFVISENYDDQNCSFLSNPDVLSKNVVVRNTYQNIFNLSEVITSSNGNYYAQVNDYKRRIHFEYIGKENTFSQVDTFNSIPISQDPSENYEKFIIYSPEGFPYSYIIWPSIFSWKQVNDTRERTYNVKITREDRTEIVKRFMLEDLVNCEPSYIEEGTSRSLLLFGSGIDGSEIYIRDIERGRDMILLEDMYQVYLGKNSTEPLTYEQFLDDIPVIYWQGPYERLIRLINVDYNRECFTDL